MENSITYSRENKRCLHKDHFTKLQNKFTSSGINEKVKVKSRVWLEKWLAEMLSKKLNLTTIRRLY